MQIRTVVALLALFASSSAFAQNLRVVPVPWVATDLTIPHAAYNGHATTFKAIARGGNGTYQYEWDFQGDGVYDFVSSTTNRYNLSTRYTYANQAVTTTFNAKVRVTSGGQTVTGTYPVRVHADVPANPANANDRQLQVLRSVAIDDGLWYLHNQMSRTGNEDSPLTGAQATGSVQAMSPSYSPTVTALYLESLGRQGHYAAFPAAYLGDMPDLAANLQRWRDDPYAEDAMRLLNYLLTQSVVVNVPVIDENNLTGFYPEVTRAPIPGTDDGIGLGVTNLDTGPLSGFVRALAVSNLTGYVAQVGDSTRILGRPFQFLMQQYVDALVWGQNEGTYAGSWYYSANGVNDLLGELGHGVMDAAEALATAEEFMGDDGVIVPNLAKARLVDYVRMNMNVCPAGGTGGTINSTTNGICDFANSAAILFALRWVDSQSFDISDARIAFPSYSGTTRGQLRAAHNSTVLFISNVFNGTSFGQYSLDNGFVEAGNWSRIDGLGDHYSMFHWAAAARVGSPQIFNFGNNDWARLFSRYLINNQATSGDWTWAQSSTLAQNNDLTFGPVGRAGWALLTLIGDSRAPFVIGQANVATAVEGTPIDFISKSETPGTVVWAFGNGATADGANVTYAYPDNGYFNATVTVTTLGGVSTDTLQVIITNATPVVNAGPDVMLTEGTPSAFSGTFTDTGTADTWTYQWVFGDSATANAQNVNKTYFDNGVFNVTFRVTDDDGATAVDTRVAIVANVPPTITSTAPTSAAEGTAYTYALTFVDPGTSDTHTCTLPTAPSNATLTSCALSWTPTGAQSAQPQAFELCVTDDDGGETCQQFSLTAAPIDVDQDGLPDSWETTYFTNIMTANPSEDGDADGTTNLQEFTAGTNPTTFDGPGSPGMQLPACSSTVTSARPTLTVTNATDPQMTPLTYTFELYADSSLTQLVAADSNVAAGTSSTSWQPPVLLLENRTYFWRARAKDAAVYGAWTSPACAFTVNVTDELPSTPQLDTPDVGAAVSSLTPTLTVRNSVDPDGDALTYEFEVRLNDTVSASAQNVLETTGTTSWQVMSPLSDGTEYRWRARATSATGSSPWSSFSRFVVRGASTASLEAPTLLSPQNGTVVDTLTPILAFVGNGRPSLFDWQLATDATFNTLVSSGDDTATTRVQLSNALTEDGVYCWRVRADDGATRSGWVKACFTASAGDGAPSVPTLLNPGNDSVVTTVNPLFSWAAASDPEGKPLNYELELSEGGAVVATVTGIGGTTALSSAPLTDGKSYTWRVRAVTGTGAPASEFSAVNAFRVEVPKTQEPTAPETSGCGCGATSPAALTPFFLLGLALLRRRRS